ncbi:hypothetical protein RMSM_02197 [Rhodopirellula maiorica SM1]|uniref:Uncharacterized protein n=1 Tax=Rhodopirellula maiorica SM1 TaxID=1265738 RepID=M5S3W7_9BACT|nr:hypothetical protein RMSM_02197 [Rhodopirellula maiorica SM1]
MNTLGVRDLSPALDLCHDPLSKSPLQKHEASRRRHENPAFC